MAINAMGGLFGSVYDLSPSTDEPVFVSWTSNAEAYKDFMSNQRALPVTAEGASI